ncbi:MAG: DNA-binding protein WhiA [Limnochordia bacterium]
MSFSSSVRDELARIIPETTCCHLAEVAGMALRMSSGPQRLEINLGNAASARKVYILLDGKNAGRPLLKIDSSRRARRYHVCVARFPGIVDQDPESLLPKRWCCQRAYLRGAFLAYGSMAAPDRMYHLEISAKSLEVAQGLMALFVGLGLTAAGLAPKRQGYVVYLKDGDHICEFLRLVGAHQALLKLENIRVMKGVKNRVNRLVNAETANVDKTVTASMHQLAAIDFLTERIGLEALPYRLRTVARARLAMPYATLAELGESLEPRLSKSAVNYRLRKLLTMAMEMGFEHSEERNTSHGEEYHR